MVDRAFRKLVYIGWRAKDSFCWRRLKVRQRFERAAWRRAFTIVKAYKQFKENVDEFWAIDKRIGDKLDAARKRDAISRAEHDEFMKRYKIGAYRV